MDGEDLASGASGGVDLRRLFDDAGGSCGLIWGLVIALSQAAPWPAAKVGMARASRSCEGHALSAFLGGGARGAWAHGVEPGSKVSTTIMGPPQDGQE